ncbi:VOC family protein [Novosphingobium aquimarinum]|uniref:VOC family protein n=1 Tax=Novosphingobium aquimarinum TaxID=2682494 RepID=UPI0012EBB5A2|nr:VOC family protein [Novosphingobium aquimarinum]
MRRSGVAPRSLAYLVVETKHVAKWRDFAAKVLGMQPEDDGRGGLSLRMDERCSRIFVSAGERDAVIATGWEMADVAAWAELCDRLRESGLAVAVGSRDLAAHRKVEGIASVKDPAGTCVELIHGAACAETPFTPGRSLSGFRTGPLGLGHAVLTVSDIAAVAPFYTDLLGFRLSDHARRPFAAAFFHLNSRHHSLAMIETGEDGFHHLMVELDSLDDVGQAYDLAQLEEGRVAVTLGRHSNDFMTSFYMRTPSDFLIEYGWGGRSIDPESWQAFECVDGPSLWGHERSWLGPEKRAEALRFRLEAAAKGLRAPDFVRSGDHQEE